MTNPILEKMARAHYENMTRTPLHPLTSWVRWSDMSDEMRGSKQDDMAAALRSLLPLDDCTVGVAHGAANKNNSGELDDDWATWGDVERAITAFILHALGEEE